MDQLLEFLPRTSTIVVLLSISLIYNIIKTMFSSNQLQPEEHAYRGYEKVFATSDNPSDKKRVMSDIQRIREKNTTFPPPYPNGWFSILASEDLKHGEVKEALFCGQNLIIWRSDQGTAYVANDTCPEVGVRFGVGSQVIGDCIQSDNWLFDGSQDGKSLDDDVSLKTWPCKEVNGYLMVWHSIQGSDPTWEMEQLPEIVGWYDLPAVHYQFATHIEDMVENGADEQHFGPIHGNTNQKGKPWWERLLSAELVECDEFKLDWTPVGEAGRSHEALMRIEAKIMLLGVFYLYTTETFLKQIGPGVVVTYQSSPWGNTVMIETTTPLESMKTGMSQKIFSSNRFKRVENISYKNAVYRQICKDSHIWNRKIRRNNPPLPKEDKNVQAFRRWFTQFYGKPVPKLAKP